MPNAGSDNNAQPAAPACSRYGREYKRPRPFTPPTASRPKRQNSILAFPDAEPDHAQQLDFDDVVDDDSESELQVVEEEMEIADNGAAQPAEPGRADGVEEDQSVSGGIGFNCPFEECRPAAARWLSVDGLIKHLLQVHVRAGQHPPLQPF